VVADLSFVSLRAVVEAAVDLFGVHTHYLLLVKPQFEVGRGAVRRGIVKDEQSRDNAVAQVADAWNAAGVTVRGVMPSPITGEKGNVEYLLYTSATPSVYPAEWDGQIPASTTGK